MSSSQLVTVVICSLVATGTLAGLWGGLSRTARILRAVRPLLSRARSLSAADRPESAFAEDWSALDGAFRADPIVAPMWVPWAASVERTEAEHGGWALAATSAPDDWFHSRSLAAGGWSDAIVARLAGLLVSLGILGTFLGLTLGLVEADFGGIRALSSADARTEALQAAMFGLLAGSSTAFVTSVAGLTGSLILTAAVRLVMARPVERALGELSALCRVGVRLEAPELRLSRQLARLAPPPSPTDTLSPVLDRLTLALESGLLPSPAPDLPELAPALQELRTAVQVLAAGGSNPEPSWAAALSERLRSPPPVAELPAELRSLLEEQQTRLSAVVDAFAVQDRRLVVLDARIRSVADAVAEVSGASATGELDRLVTVLEGLTQPHHTAPAGASTSETLEAAASTAVGDSVRITLAPTLESLTRVARRFDEASRRFETATGGLTDSASTNRAAATQLQQASADLGTRLAVLQQSTAAIRTALAHHTDASAALTTAAASLQGVGPQLATAADQVKLGARSMELTTERLAAQQAGGSRAELERVVQALEAVVASLQARS